MPRPIAWNLVVISLLVAALSSGGLAAQQPRPIRQLTWAMLNYWGDWDPAEGTSAPHYRVFVNAYEALVGYKLGRLELEPVLAERWEVSKDLRTYTFFLRRGVKFHDGSALTAQDVKNSLERIIAQKKSPASYLTSVARVSVVNSRTVRISLKGPSVTFVDAATRAYIHKVPAGVKVAPGANWFVKGVNGTGPYKLVQDVPNDRLVFERHKDYWRGWPDGAPDRVILRAIPEVATRRILLDRGEVDGIDYVWEESSSVYEQRGARVFLNPSLRTFMMNMNTVGGRTANINFRKALTYAFPYEQLKPVFQGQLQVPNGFLAPGLPGYDPSLPKFKQDLAKAKEFLAAAGYPNGGVTIKLMYWAGEEQGRRMALLVQEALKQLNVNLEIIPAGFPLIQKALSEAKGENGVEILAHLIISPLTADMSSYMRLIFGSANAGKPWNLSLYSNPEFDRLLARAEVTTDRTAREDLWKQAHSLAVRDYPVVFVGWITPISNIFSQRVTRYVFHPLEYNGVPYFYGIRTTGR
jgi:peptide/nickel transport system substrate-binding protein